MAACDCVSVQYVMCLMFPRVNDTRPTCPANRVECRLAHVGTRLSGSATEA